MFWGLIMEPNKRYTQYVEKAFHLSMASLDVTTANNSINGGLAQVMVHYENRNYLICTLSQDKVMQVPLDLNFEKDSKISFTCNGSGHIHLTGYLIPEQDEDMLNDSDEFDSDEVEEEEVPELVGSNKRKAESTNDKKEVKRPKNVEVTKVEEVDEDDDDDSDSDLEDIDTDGSDSELSEDENDLEDSEDDDEDEEDSDEDDDEEEEEVKAPEAKPAKKEKQKQNKQNQQQQNKQNQQQQQQNQSQNKDKKDKKEKNKMVNGKQEKSEKEQPKQKKGKNDNKNDSKSDDNKAEQQQQQQKRRTAEGGVQIEDIKTGQGAPAKHGKFVSIYYIGRLKNGKKFDATQQGDGFKFRLGRGEVIKGLDIGIAGMKIGGKRRISIPANMAYGAKGSPPVIPPNSWLNFEVELKGVH